MCDRMQASTAVSSVTEVEGAMYSKLSVTVAKSTPLTVRLSDTTPIPLTCGATQSALVADISLAFTICCPKRQARYGDHSKFEPLTVTTTPPAVEDMFGSTPVTTGVAEYV